MPARPRLPVPPMQLPESPRASWEPLPESARILAFPWSCVMHDNHRLIPAKGRRGLVASPEYRRRKAVAATLARLQWGRAPLLQGDLVLVARCYFPDRRRRDAGNLRKSLTDALTGTVYADDSQLVCETWRRAGIVPKDAARIEVCLYADGGRADA